MKTSMLQKGIPMLQGVRARVGLFLAVLALGGAACIGQENVSEGDRCNPLASSNTCASGLVCTGQGSSPSIPFCPENYCCSVDGSGNLNSSNPNCQPGCNGGAAAICTATMDPGACALSMGASLQTAMAMDEDAGGAMTPPAEAGGGDAPAGDGGGE
jgi:hypothetical protein